jgi:crotonobetainyl-CoA:carnitine CoA-transferase CaiB-like acyl-CoA transferase
MLLAGLKVVELATWVAGPACGAIMADWGADVVKVESAAGDPTRLYAHDTAESPGSPIFSMENRGKRGIVLDTGSATGREAMVALLKGADIFVTNVRPGALRRARLDFEVLKDEFPHLIYASVSGYGLEGEGADIPAFDLTAFWNRSGVAAATNPPGAEPLPCRPGFGDHVTALAALSGILAALHERGRTGQGRLVEASLIRAGVYALGWDMSVHLRYGQADTAVPRNDRPNALAGYFQTADSRWIYVVPRGPSCFSALMRAIDQPEIAADPRFSPPINDLVAVRELRGVLERAFSCLTMAQAGERLTRADLIWAPMASLDEVAVDPLAQAAGCFVETPDGWGGSFAAPASPIRFPGMAPAPARAAPKLGEHTRVLLAMAGYAPDAIEAMLAAGTALQASAAGSE